MKLVLATRNAHKVAELRPILAQALAATVDLETELVGVDAFAGDRYVLCSDGLYEFVEDDRIAATLRRLDDPSEAAHELVRLANEGGGRDNITIVVLDVESSPAEG